MDNFTILVYIWTKHDSRNNINFFKSCTEKCMIWLSTYSVLTFIWVFPKIGKHPKMDGENNGKTLLKWDDLGGKPTIFGNIHIAPYSFSSNFSHQRSQVVGLFSPPKKTKLHECPPWKTWAIFFFKGKGLPFSSFFLFLRGNCHFTIHITVSFLNIKMPLEIKNLPKSRRKCFSRILIVENQLLDQQGHGPHIRPTKHQNLYQAAPDAIMKIWYCL